MRIIQPEVKLIEEPNPLKKIELVGRTCYKSTDRITDSSAPTFVSGLISRGHEAMLEHTSFCFVIPITRYLNMVKNIQFMENTDPEFKCFLRFTQDRRFLVSGNVRAWRDYLSARYRVFHSQDSGFQDMVKMNPVLFPEWLENIQWSPLDTPPAVPIPKASLVGALEIGTHYDITASFICDRGITHEIVRHRTASFAQESTRYCNYSKGQFNGEITVIEPNYLEKDTPLYRMWEHSCKMSEVAYFDLLGEGCSPQQARAVLPNSLKSEIIMTSNVYGWGHFFDLRYFGKTGAPHPQMVQVAKMAYDHMMEECPGQMRVLKKVE